MENKKNPKANLEKFKLMFFGTGLAVSIILLILAFKYETSTAVSEFNLDQAQEEEEMMEITRQDLREPPPPPPQEQQQQQTIEVMNLVNNDENITDDDFEVPEYDEEDDINLEETEDEEEDQIFMYAEKMPEFPGGTVALQKYIANHVNYPAEARENGIEGTVFLRFEVTKTGKIGKVELQKGVDPILDQEAIKVIKTLPKFTPGEQNGKKVSVWFSIPVTFKLN